MGNLKPLKPEQLVRALEKLGFIQLRQKGSHLVLKHPDGRWATIPIHKGKDLTKGLIHKILNDAELSWNQIEKYL